MEDFKLPEYWAVRSTNDEQDYEIVEYINKTFNTDIGKGLLSNAEWWYSNSRSNVFKERHEGSSINSFFHHCTEITYEQFLQYVVYKDTYVEKTEPDLELEGILKKLLNV